MRAFVVAALVTSCAAHGEQPTVVIGPSRKCDAEIDRVARDLCLVRAFIEEARVNKDIIKIVCLKEKETKLEALRDQPGDAERAAKADALEHESEQCIGELTLHQQ